MNLHGEELVDYCICETIDEELSQVAEDLDLGVFPQTDVNKYL